MAKKDKTRAQKKQIRRRKRNLSKAERYERASDRKEKRASKLLQKSGGTGKKYGRGQRVAKEASNFSSSAKKTKKSKGASKPKSRTSMQVTKKSVARNKYRNDKAFRNSAAGRDIEKSVKRQDRRIARRKKRRSR